MFKNKTHEGYFFALLAYSSWGFFPLYWPLLHRLSAFEILFQRLAWSLLFFTILLWSKKQKWGIQWEHLTNPWVWISAFLLASNWLIYIYAVNSHQILESSLGYFINPLVNVG
ncbi:MAG: EamA family transporter, partial [Pseudobdellovibrionaceae bacterium]